jgi:hypothetical protein
MQGTSLSVAATSIQVLFALEGKLMARSQGPPGAMNALRAGLRASSERYANYFRSASTAFTARGCTFSDHGYLPFAILPGVPTPQSPAFVCNGCEREMAVAKESFKGRSWCGLCLALIYLREDQQQGRLIQ